MSGELMRQNIKKAQCEIDSKKDMVEKGNEMPEKDRM